MVRDADRYASWLELVGDLLQASPPGGQAFPHAVVAELLRESFHSACCMRNAVDETWHDRVVGSWPEDFLPAEAPGDRLPDRSWHPLVRWYATTRSSHPQTMARVPGAVADRRMHQEWVSFARPMGITHQLVVPLDGEGRHVYIVSRPDRDYTEDDLALADRLAPVLGGVLRQHGALAIRPAVHVRRGRDLGLTARETAVLVLLGDGLTAASIARRLGCSPRTVHKHLERLYRKLGVSDRLMAVHMGRYLGLL